MTKSKAKKNADAGPSSEPSKTDDEKRKADAASVPAPDSLKIKSKPEPVSEKKDSNEVPVEVSRPDVKDDKPGFLSGLLSLKDEPEGKAPTGKRKRGRPRKPKPFKLSPEELAELILIPGLLMAAERFIPEEIRPEDDEVNGFCMPWARIIVRHLPEVPMSEDAIDLGQMLLAGLSYRIRIAPIVKAMKEAQQSAETETEGIENGNEVRVPVSPDRGNGSGPDGTGRTGLSSGGG